MGVASRQCSFFSWTSTETETPKKEIVSVVDVVWDRVVQILTGTSTETSTETNVCLDICHLITGSSAGHFGFFLLIIASLFGVILCCIFYRKYSHYQHVARSSLTNEEKWHPRWYHGCVSYSEAKHRLIKGAGNNDGSYLVFDDPDGQHILLVYYKGETLRWRITKHDAANGVMYMLGENVAKDSSATAAARYKTIRELIKAHRGVTGKPIMLKNGKTVTLSKSYVYKINN